MQRPTKTKIEKIKEFYKKYKETFHEVIALIIYACIAIVFGLINYSLKHGLIIMSTLILFDVLVNQFYIQRTYYKIKEIEEKLK